MSNECKFKPRFCRINIFNELKRLYDEYVTNNQLDFRSALERFETIAEETIKPKIIKLLITLKDKKRLNEAQNKKSIDQKWRSCKGSLYEYAVCKALNEILMNDPSSAQRLDIIHGSQLNDPIRKQLTIKNWSEILPDADFVIINKASNKVVAILSCKTSLRERLTETAFWAKELKPKGIDVIFITTDKDEEVTADVNRYIVMHVLDYTIITDPNRYNEIISEWRGRYGDRQDFDSMINKVISFRNIIEILQQYVAKS